jgi:hypothetical protein
MGDLITKKGKKKESTAPVLNILEAVVKMHDPVYRAVGDTIAKNDGTTFTVEKPHISCQLELVDAGRANKKHIGTTWYERFYFVETEKGSGEYENRPGTKIGGLSEARYGPGFWESDQVLKAEDLDEFEFVCSLKPKTKFGSTEVTGTCVDHETIQPLSEEDEPEFTEEEESMLKEALPKVGKG